MPPMLLTLVVNMPPVLLNVDTGGQHVAGVVDTGGEHAAGVVDTDSQHAAGVVDMLWCTLNLKYLHNFLRKTIKWRQWYISIIYN